MATVTVTRSPAQVRYFTIQEVEITVSVFDDEGDPADASAVTLTSTRPEGVDVDVTLAHSTTGVYTATVSLDAEGRWIFKGQATGSLVAAGRLSIAVDDDGSSGVPADEQLVLVADPSSEGDVPQAPQSGGFVLRRHAIRPDIDLTGVEDASSELNRLLNLRDGVCVEIPWGSVVRVDDEIVMNKQGCSLVGPRRGHRLSKNVFRANGYATSGALLNITHTGTGFSFPQPNCLVEGLELFYTQQPLNATPVAHDWTFDLTGGGADGCAVQDITCMNPYKFITVAANGATVDSVRAFPRLYGLHLGRCPEVIYCNRIEFNPRGDDAITSTVTDWVFANGFGIILDGCEDGKLTNIHAFGYLIGVRNWDLDADAFPGCYYNVENIDIEGTRWCIEVAPVTDGGHGLCSSGGKFTDVTLVPDTDYAVIFRDTHTPASVAQRPVISLVNASVHASTHIRSFWMQSGSYGILNVSGKGGIMKDFTSGLAKNDSATALINLDGIGTASGLTRVETTGAGPVTDRNGYVVSATAIVRQFDDSWDAEYYNNALTAAVGAANFYSVNAKPGLYDVEVYLEVLATATSGTIAVNIFCDDNISSTRTYTTSTVNVAGNNRISQAFVVEADGSSNLAYSTTFTAVVGTPTYSVRISVKARTRNG